MKVINSNIKCKIATISNMTIYNIKKSVDFCKMKPKLPIISNSNKIKNIKISNKKISLVKNIIQIKTVIMNWMRVKMMINRDHFLKVSNLPVISSRNTKNPGAIIINLNMKIIN